MKCDKLILCKTGNTICCLTGNTVRTIGIVDQIMKPLRYYLQALVVFAIETDIFVKSVEDLLNDACLAMLLCPDGGAVDYELSRNLL